MAMGIEAEVKVSYVHGQFQGYQGKNSSKKDQMEIWWHHLIRNINLYHLQIKIPTKKGTSKNM